MRGLRVQLAVFYLALSLPALLLIEHASIIFEFQRCLDQLDDGRVQRVLQAQADELAQALRDGATDSEIELRLQRFVLRLERPRESLGTSAAYVLLELAERPFHAEVRVDGQLRWSAGPPVPKGDGFVQRHWSSVIVPTDDPTAAAMQLSLDLSVPSPWQRFGERLSFEWPIAVAFLVIFLLGSAWFLRRRVLVRVGAIGEAARAWARGDFGTLIDDRGGDELSALAGDLDRMAADLQALVSARAQLATLEERQRLARDLHDTVKQKVFALSLQLAAAREGAADATRAQQRLAEASSLVEEIQRELADQLRELSAPDSAVDDLVPALQQRLADFARRSGCAVRKTLPPRLELGPTEADAVLRIVDEALANIWRHAEARSVDVRLERSGSRVRLCIADDGRGGATDSTGGMGLSNIRHRSATLQSSQLKIDSSDGGGTRLSLAFDATPRATDGR